MHEDLTSFNALNLQPRLLHLIIIFDNNKNYEIYEITINDTKNINNQ